MSQVTRSFAVAVAAGGAVGLLVLPAPAQAADCQQWGFDKFFELHQSNGYDVFFNSDGTTAQGTATSVDSKGGQSTGTLADGITGRKVDFRIFWDGTTGRYTANVADDGSVSGGVTVDLNNPNSHATWTTSSRLKCMDAPAAPAAPPPGAIHRVTVNADVDVYDTPGGNGKIVGKLEGYKDDDGATDHVQFFGCQPDNWCQVGFGAAPGGKGWVWGDFLDNK